MSDSELYEIHTHLYGCLKEEDIQWLGYRKQPRWHIYQNSYRKLYGYDPDISLLEKYKIFSSHPVKHPLNEQQKQILRNFYVYDQNKPVGFDYFQLCFDFIISLSHTDPEELKEIALRVVSHQEAFYTEYRMMFSPLINHYEFQEKVYALIEGLEKAEIIYNKKAKLIISISREKSKSEWQYEILKQIYKSKSQSILIGIDFAGKEEGFPPKEKKSLLQKIQKESPYFVILYHVGESFTDKTPGSAIRWILEAHQMGVDRLGHAIALGYTKEKVQNQIYREIHSERIDHIQYLTQLYEKGEQWIPIDYLIKTKPEEQSKTQWLSIQYSGKELQLFLDFRDYCLEILKKENAIIESCPTSNIRIAGFSPLKSFIQAHLNICIGTDDPEILQTHLKKELQIASNIINDPAKIQEFQNNNQKYCSEAILKNRNQDARFHSITP